ncbi:MAG: hypothetical protein A2Y12_02410 [Planctomycetes bacterium GWF2_42_9]|nr:MAG: hypothetical protein A2Y12_02410 [Planctomycetes bacterium GWF2_42_9]
MKFDRIKAMLATMVVFLAVESSLQAAVSYQSALTWTDPLVYPICSLAAGDLNRDGKKDILVGLDESIPSYQDAHLIMLVQGDMLRTGFSQAGRANCGWTPARVFVKDLNMDGNNDILECRDITNYDFLGNITGYAGTFARRLSLSADPNIGTANWSYSQIGNIAGWFTGPAIIDLNQDGKLDLVRVRNKDGQVSRYFGDGIGNFNAGYLNFMNFNYGSTDPNDQFEKYPIVAGQLDATNSSGINDIAIARPSDGLLHIIFQHPAGGFNVDPIYVARPFSCGGFGVHGTHDLHLRPTHLGIGDFNRDGKNDIVVIREDGYVYVCYQEIPRDFASNRATLMSYGKKITDMKVGDVDGNGSDDLVVARSNGDLYVNLQGAPGVFNNQLIGSFYTDDPNVGLITCVDIADMDNDGLNDIVVGLKDGRIFTYYQQQMCSQNIQGDLTGDCMIDFRDVNVFVSQWLQTTSSAPYLPTDLNTDGIVNLKDVATIGAHWMECNLINQSNCWQ